MTDSQDYYGYKPPANVTPPPPPVEEVVEDVKPARGAKPARAAKEKPVREKPVRMTRAEKKALELQKRKEAIQKRKDAAKLKGETPVVALDDEDPFASGSAPASPGFDIGYGDSAAAAPRPVLPEGYGEVRDIDYSGAEIPVDAASLDGIADAEYEALGDKKGRKKPASKKGAPKKAPLKPSEKKAIKKGKKALPDDAANAMQGVKLTKKQIKDAKKIDPVEAAKSFRQLALMMSVSRDEIGPIRRIGEQYKGTPIGTVFAKISSDMADNNISFSAAFDKHGRVFPQVVVSLVSVGARAGKEFEALVKAAQIIQDNAKTGKQIKSALSEPLFTLILTVLFLFVVLFGIIPQFKVVFDTLNKPLPMLSQILINTSTVVGWLTGFAVIAVIGWIIYWKQKGQYNEDLRVWIDTKKLNMKPKIFGDLMMIGEVSQIFSNLHTLREINMSERDTLITTARSSQNWAMRRHLLQHVDLMDKGEARFKELANNKLLFPVDAAYTLVVGEDAGQGTQTIGMMAETYKEEAELSAAQLVVAIGPIANGAVGLVYMLVMLASYLPVFEMYTSIGSAS